MDALCLSVRLGHDLSCGWGLANPVVVMVLLNYFTMFLFLPLSDIVVPPQISPRLRDFVESDPVSLAKMFIVPIFPACGSSALMAKEPSEHCQISGQMMPTDLSSFYILF